MRAFQIESYERVLDCGNSIRVEGSTFGETVTAKSAADAVEEYLNRGGYDEGQNERIVVVSVDGVDFGEYTAPEIRRIQARKAGHFIAIIDGIETVFSSYEAAAEATDQPDVREWRIIHPDGEITTPEDVRQD